MLILTFIFEILKLSITIDQQSLQTVNINGFGSYTPQCKHKISLKYQMTLQKSAANVT